MKPWCDVPLCTRQMAHQHPAGSLQTPLEASVDVQTLDPVLDTPVNGTGPQERSAEQVGKALIERARAQRNGSKAEPEQEPAADGAADWNERWGRFASEMDAAERKVTELRARRRELLEEMRPSMSLGDIASVTGISRQRVDQILKG